MSEHRVHRNSRHAHVALHSLVVRVVASVRRQVEGNRHACLTGGEVGTVEGVGLLGGREAGILADGPWPVRVHRSVWAARVGEFAGLLLACMVQWEAGWLEAVAGCMRQWLGAQWAGLLSRSAGRPALSGAP